jgi:hypothetical protein
MAAANKDFLIFHLPVCTLEKQCEAGSFVPGEIRVGEWNFLAASKTACGPCLPLDHRNY